MENQSTNQTFGIDPQTIRRNRELSSDPNAIFDKLVSEVKQTIARWSDAEEAPWGRIYTRSPAAANMLIAKLRDDGFVADRHWHSSKDRIVVQYALDESYLDYCHERK